MSYFPKDTAPADGSTNVPDSNGVFDALALKAPLAAPTFTTRVVSPAFRSTGSQATTVTTSATITLTAGTVHVINSSSQTYTLSNASLVTGDICYLVINNGCPGNTVDYTDLFGSTSLSMNTNQKYYFMILKASSGILLIGNAT